MQTKNDILVTLHVLESQLSKLDAETIIRTLSQIRLNSLVNYLIYHDKPYDENDMEIMRVLIKILQHIYNNSDVTPPISDELYDQLYAAMMYAGGGDIIGADVGSDRPIMYHQYPDLRGTLDKVHFFLNSEKSVTEKRRSIENWVTSIENKLGRKMTTTEGEIMIFPKFDGVSVVFECDKDGNVERALTRGSVDKNEACEIPIFRGFKFRPYSEWEEPSPFGIKTEIIMGFENFKKFCKKYGEFKSPRSAVSSIINGQTVDIDHLRYITIIPLRIQNFTTDEVVVHPDAYTVFPFSSGNISTLSDIKELSIQFNDIARKMEEMLQIPCDGVVVYLVSRKLQKLLGRENHINKYEVAYKFPPMQLKTKLIDVEFSMGLMGYLSPVATFEPIVIHGNTIRNASLGSIERFESLKLRKGDEVIIQYEIIPYLTKNEDCKSGDGEWIQTPTHCKFCNEPLCNYPLLQCINPQCPTRMIGSIVNYINELNIMNISDATVTTLFNYNLLQDIEDLYKLKDYKNMIVQIPGFGKKQFEKIIKSIDARRTVKDYELLGALGIKDARSRKFKSVSSIYYIDELIKICKKNDSDKLRSIKGIGAVLATNIINGILKNEELIKFLMNELTIIKTKGSDNGELILFSKVKNTKDFENYLEEKGYEIANGYNKDVSLVIVPSLDVVSNKIDKARKDGKEIITIADAYKKFNYGGSINV